MNDEKLAWRANKLKSWGNIPPMDPAQFADILVHLYGDPDQYTEEQMEKHTLDTIASIRTLVERGYLRATNLENKGKHE